MSSQSIPFLDLNAAYAELQPEIEAAVLATLRSGMHIGGEAVEAFEHDFAAFTGAAHGVALSNGLDALYLALRALDVGPGDEVIVPSNTFVATWFAVSQCGATPVPVEPDEGTCNITAATIRAAITPRTRVLMPVHLYGQPAELDAILALARAHGLRVVEDAAQAQGARWRGRRIGAHADLVCWSFYPGKNLGAFGDAGAITTDDTALAERVAMLRNYGSRQKYVHELRGGNHRMDPLQAAALRVKLGHLERWNRRREDLAAAYTTGLAGSGLVLPRVAEGADPVWHLYVVRTPRRDALQQHLAQQGIGSLIHYPIPPHRQQAYAAMGIGEGRFPIAERMAREVLSLPMGPHLRDAQQRRVIDSVQDFLRGS